MKFLTVGFRVHPPFRLDEGREKEEMLYRPCGEKYSTIRFYYKDLRVDMSRV